MTPRHAPKDQTPEQKARRLRAQRYYERRSGKSAQFAQGDLDTVSPEELRRCIAELTCPWCVNGPFQNLGTHTYMAHGVTARAMKEAAIVPVVTPLVDGRTSEKLSDHWFRHEDRLREQLLVGGQSEAQRQGLLRAMENPTPLAARTREAMTAKLTRMWAQHADFT